MTPQNVSSTPELISVFVDGQERMLPKGKNLLRALLDDGIYIPHYCYHPSLSIAGSCRLCLIEIEGAPKPEVSCNMIVSEGRSGPLRIKTKGELVESSRKGMMEFLLVNHPLDCPICDRGGECMLQRYSVEYGSGIGRTVESRRRFPKPQFDPLIDIERNRCILCSRCVRFTEEVGGEHVMGIFGHGNRNYIGTYADTPITNPFSGNIIDLCPVGCLTSKPFRFNARVWELRQTHTTTRTCNGMVTAWTRGNKLHRVTPPSKVWRDSYFSIDDDTQDFISNQARFGSMYVNHPKRLLKPLVAEKDGTLIESNWEHALRNSVNAIQAADPNEVCILVGERSTNEESFLLGRLARVVIGTPYIDWRSRFISWDAAQCAGKVLEASNADFSVIESNPVLLIGADDLSDAAPDIALRFHEAARLKRTPLALWGIRTDPWLGAHAVLTKTSRPEQFADQLDRLAQALETRQESPEGLEDIYEYITKHGHGVICVGMDLAGGAILGDIAPSIYRLSAAIKDDWYDGVLPLTAARNAKGAVACGAQNDHLPTGSEDNPVAIHHFENIFGEIIKTTSPDITAPELLRMAAQGKFKVLFLHRCDELVTHPQRALIERALRATPFVIMVDTFPSWMTELADVVLPGTVFYETDGSMADIDGTLRRMKRGVQPAGEAQEEWRIIESFSALLGATKVYQRVDDVFMDLCRSWQIPSFMHLNDLLIDNPGSETPQRHHTFAAGKSVLTSNFKLNFAERHPVPSKEMTSKSTFVPSSGMLRLLWTRHASGDDHPGDYAAEYKAMRPNPKLELNPDDALQLGLNFSDFVEIIGSAGGPLAITINASIPRGIAYGAINVIGLQLDHDPDPMPEIRLKKFSEAHS